MTPTTTTDDAPGSTMEILQNEMRKKAEREAAEKEREARLADEPLGPDRMRTSEDELAYYEFAGGVEKGDVIEWDDGEVDEVIGVVPAQQLLDPEFDIPGDIIHYRVLEECEDADSYSIVNRAGDQGDMRDWMLGGDLARGNATITRGEL